MTQAHRIAELVGTLRGLVGQAEADWRRHHLPPLSRDRPRADADAIHGARTIEAASRELDLIGGQIRTLPRADPGRLVARLGADAPARLAEAEEAILAHGAFLLELLAPAGPAGPSGLAPDDLRRAIDHLGELARRRAELLA